MNRSLAWFSASLPDLGLLPLLHSFHPRKLESCGLLT